MQKWWCKQKQELFLRLCALNLLNALVKLDEYKGILNYDMVKPKVIFLVKNIVTSKKTYLYDELYVKPSEDCLYVRCYGLQFGFHRIGSKALAKVNPNICKEDGVWDGVRLQPIAVQLYEFAKEAIEQGLGESYIKGKILLLTNRNN